MYKSNPGCFSEQGGPTNLPKETTTMEKLNAILALLNDAKSSKPSEVGLAFVMEACKTLGLGFDATAMILDSLEYGYITDSNTKFYFYTRFKYAIDHMPKTLDRKGE